MKYTFGFIGAGNMGSALIKATAKSFPKNDIAFFDKHPEKCQLLDSFATVLRSAEEVAKNCKFVFIGVKPQAYQVAFDGIKNALIENPNAIIVSMAAGISIDGVKKISGLDLPVIRIMPNTPCQIGKGVVLCSYSDGVADNDKKAFLTALAGAGFVDEIPEDKIDAGSVVSGCGPAFVYMYINALKNAGISCGLSDDKALSYAIKTVIGSAEMVTASTEDISTLIKRVCSPGGTTIEGVKSFEEDDLNGVVEKALKASYKRTLELKK